MSRASTFMILAVLVLLTFIVGFILGVSIEVVLFFCMIGAALLGYILIEKNDKDKSMIRVIFEKIVNRFKPLFKRKEKTKKPEQKPEVKPDMSTKNLINEARRHVLGYSVILGDKKIVNLNEELVNETLILLKRIETEKIDTQAIRYLISSSIPRYRRVMDDAINLFGSIHTVKEFQEQKETLLDFMNKFKKSLSKINDYVNIERQKRLKEEMEAMEMGNSIFDDD